MSLRIILILLVQVGAIALLAIGSNASNQEENTDEFLRARLGHFHRMKDPRYLEIYEEYFKNVLKKRDKSLEAANVNQWVNVRPTAHTCLDYLQYFRVKKYTLQKPFDIILLDACLDWLYDQSDEKRFDVDQLGKTNTVKLSNLAEDQTFKQIFASTQFKTDSLPRNLTNEIYNYIMRLLEVHAGNPSNGCHSLWMDAYNDFIEQVYIGNCETEEGCNFYGIEHSDDDSYLRLIAQSTKEATASCYNVMQKQMPALWKESRRAEDHSSFRGKVKAAIGKLMGQTEQSILQLVSGGDPNKSVDLAQVADDLRRIKAQDEKAIKRMTGALANYVKHNADLGSTAGDAYGRVRYGRALTKLCRSYTDPNFFLAATGGAAVDEDPDVVKKPFDFYHLIYSLVKVTNHEPVYGVSKEKFEKDIIRHKWVPLYLATLACQIIATSVGSLNFDSNEGNFEVELDLAARVLYADWPISAIVSKLKPDPDSRKKSFSLFNRHKGHDDDSDSDSEDYEESRVPHYTPAPHQQQPAPAPAAAGFQVPLANKPKEVKYSPPILDANGHVIHPPIPLPSMSEESIKMFILLKGRYPNDMPPNIDKYYTWMPALLNQVRKSRLDDVLSKVKTTPQAQPASQPSPPVPSVPSTPSVQPSPVPSQPQEPQQRKFIKVSKKNGQDQRSSPLMGRKRTRVSNGSEKSGGFDRLAAVRAPAASFAPNAGSAPAYNFGPPAAAPAPFTFGANNQPTPQPQQQPAFVFGSPNNQPQPPQQQQQPAFVFGANNNNNQQQQQQPAFVFGANNNQPQQQQQQQPAFVFGANNQKPQQPPAPVTKFEPPTSGFSMGASGPTDKENKFSLANVPESSVNPAKSMGFGAPTSPLNNNPFATGPSFGSQSSNGFGGFGNNQGPSSHGFNFQPSNSQMGAPTFNPGFNFRN